MAVEKTRSKKELKELRREVELLRAQLKITAPEIKRGAVPVQPVAKSKAPESPKHAESIDIDDSYVKKDLLKTIVLSTMAFTTIFLIWYF